ncbi:spermidine/putrescine ABC transporter substrate-binding protein [soil metagenome]
MEPFEGEQPLEQPLLSRAISRRRMLQGSAVAGISAFLAACGTAGTSPSATAGRTGTPAGTGTADPTGGSTDAATDAPSMTDGGQLGGELNFANWTAYIDLTETEDGEYVLPSPTLDQFTEATGITVSYQETINDNEEFFGTDLQGPLSQGVDTGWDIVVLTDFMAGRLIRLGWVEEIDTSGMENYPANLQDQYKGRPIDPDTSFAAPWQSGMTGLGYDSEVTGELTSLDALWDEQWAGRVTYLSDMRDAVGLSALRLGYPPEEITDEQFDEALAEIQSAVDAGIVRRFTGNDYLQDLTSGDAVLSMAWSGDMIQLQFDKESARFEVPAEGGNLWTDNMLIPRGARNKAQAEAFIDFYYDPAIAAQVEAFVYYVCPVKGAREAIAEIDEEAAESPLIFPTPEMVARLHGFRALDEATEQRYQSAFNAVAGV